MADSGIKNTLLCKIYLTSLVYLVIPPTNPSNQVFFVQLQCKKVGTVGRKRFVARYNKIPSKNGREDVRWRDHVKMVIARYSFGSYSHYVFPYDFYCHLIISLSLYILALLGKFVYLYLDIYTVYAYICR